MPKLTMLKGLPASGKTTLARQFVKESGNSGRINRDDLRAMLFNSEWTGKREDVVVACEKAIASVLFERGMNAVIDDTNLTQRHRDMWSAVAKQAAQHFEVTNLDVDIQTCMDRDAERPNSVGESVITRLAAIGGLIDWGDEIILCDIDGTLANGEHREHLVRGENKDWDAYYALLGDDTPIDIICRWMWEEFRSGRTIVLVSGRPDTYQRETKRWLIDNRINYHYLFMRGGNDKRPDTMVKADILKLIPKEKIVCVADDRPSVIRMWKENGLRVIPVRGACEEF